MRPHPVAVAADVDELEEPDRAILGDRQADGQVRPADARRAEQDHVLGALDEAELLLALDLLALDARLEGEVELGQGLHRRQPGGTHRGLQAAVVAQHTLGL